METLTPVTNALYAHCGALFQELGEYCRTLLILDVYDLWNEPEWQHCLALDVVAELMRRIGGNQNLSGYVDCLEAGAKRRQ